MEATETHRTTHGATRGARPLRDPLSLSFQAHRQLMLLRLRWHGRRTPETDADRPTESV